MEHFNRLTPAEAERLALLAEKCGDPETAEDLRGQEVYLPVAAPVAAEGTWTTTRWHAELTDIIALCKAVSYPGLRFVSNKSLAVRT